MRISFSDTYSRSQALEFEMFGVAAFVPHHHRDGQAALKGAADMHICIQTNPAVLPKSTSKDMLNRRRLREIRYVSRR